MKKYSKEVDIFLTNVILPKLNFKNYNEENISDIVQYIFSEIEGPLCEAEESGKTLSPEESKLLRIATLAITEITTREDWNN